MSRLSGPGSPVRGQKIVQGRGVVHVELRAHGWQGRQLCWQGLGALVMLYIQRGQLQHPGDVNVPSAVGAGGDQPEHVLCGPAARRCGNLVHPDGFGVGSVENYRELITPAARWIIAAKLVSVLSLRIAIRLNSLSLPKKFSIKWRHL